MQAEDNGILRGVIIACLAVATSCGAGSPTGGASVGDALTLIDSNADRALPVQHGGSWLYAASGALHCLPAGTTEPVTIGGWGAHPDAHLEPPFMSLSSDDTRAAFVDASGLRLVDLASCTTTKIASGTFPAPALNHPGGGRAPSSGRAAHAFSGDGSQLLWLQGAGPFSLFAVARDGGPARLLADGVSNFWIQGDRAIAVTAAEGFDGTLLSIPLGFGSTVAFPNAFQVATCIAVPGAGAWTGVLVREGVESAANWLWNAEDGRRMFIGNERPSPVIGDYCGIPDAAFSPDDRWVWEREVLIDTATGEMSPYGLRDATDEHFTLRTDAMWHVFVFATGTFVDVPTEPQVFGGAAWFLDSDAQGTLWRAPLDGGARVALDADVGSFEHEPPWLLVRKVDYSLVVRSESGDLVATRPASDLGTFGSVDTAASIVDVSPDGNVLLFARDYRPAVLHNPIASFTLMAVPLSGGTPITLRENVVAYAFDPQRPLVDVNGWGGIVAISLDGSTSTVLTDRAPPGLLPLWSPDRRRALVAETTGSEEVLLVVLGEGFRQPLLPSTPDLLSSTKTWKAVWAGRRLFFTAKSSDGTRNGLYTVVVP